MSMGYGFSGLVAYSVVVSLVAAVFIGLYSNCNKTENEIVNGDEHKMVENKLDILTFNNSDLQEEGDTECNCWGNLTFSLLEIIVIGVLSMGFLTGLVKLVIFLRGKALKRKKD